jgi:hypothetical protein
MVIYIIIPVPSAIRRGLEAVCVIFWREYPGVFILSILWLTFVSPLWAVYKPLVAISKPKNVERLISKLLFMLKVMGY